MTWSHGSITGYSRCNGGGRLACQTCRDARARRAAEIKLRRLYQRPAPTDRLDPTLALQALHGMRQAGHNTIAIAKLTGLPNQRVGRILNHGTAFVTRAVHEQIVAGWQWMLAHPEWRMPTRYVDSSLPRQQLRSLQALGWPMRELCEQAGIASSSRADRAQIHRDLAGRIQRLYDDLSGTRGPSRVAATAAAKNGWHTPLAYDDDGRLIPGSVPNDLTRAAERREDRRTRESQVAELTARGLSTAEIAARLGITDRTVTRARSSRRTA